MMYLQIKVINGNTLYTFNVCQKTSEIVNGKNVYKSATEYLSIIEYNTLKDTNLFIEKEKFVKE